MCYRVLLSERAVSALPPSPGWICNPWRLPQAPHSLRDATLKLVFEIVPKTQARMAKLPGEPFAPCNKETQQYLDQLTTALTERRDAAAVAVKDVRAKAMSVGGNKPAKKEKVA